MKNFAISSGSNFAAILSVLWIACAATTIISSIIWLVNAYNEVRIVNHELGNKRNAVTSLFSTIMPSIFSILGFLLIGAEVFEQARILNNSLSGLSQNTPIADTLKYVGIGFFGISGIIFLVTLFFLCKQNNQKNEEESDENDHKRNTAKKISPKLRNTLFAFIFCFTSIGALFFFNEKIKTENFFKTVHGFNQRIDATFALIIGFLAIGVGIFINDFFQSCYSKYLDKHFGGKTEEYQPLHNINIMMFIFSGAGVISLITNITLHYTVDVHQANLSTLEYGLFAFGVMMITLALVIKCVYPENNRQKYKSVTWNDEIFGRSNNDEQPNIKDNDRINEEDDVNKNECVM